MDISSRTLITEGAPWASIGRSMPEEERPPETGRRFARGIFDGDRLPQADPGGGERLPATRLDLSVMELGGAWLRSALALLSGSAAADALDPAVAP